MQMLRCECRAVRSATGGSRRVLLPLWLAVAVLLGLPGIAAAESPTYGLRDKDGVERSRVRIADIFTPFPYSFRAPVVTTDPAALSRVIRSVLAYMDRQDKRKARREGILAYVGLPRSHAKATLQYLAYVLGQDQAEGRKQSRISDPAFIYQHFDRYAWKADVAAAAARGQKVPPGRLRISRYYVTEVPASPSRTAAMPCALYEVPRDEIALSDGQAAARKGSLWRYRLARREVMAGAYETGGVAAGMARPLVFLACRDLEAALLNGAIAVVMPSGERRLYTSYRSNERAYVTGRAQSQQEKYWYFRQDTSPHGLGNDASYAVAIEPYVVFAGDVENVGVGTLIAIQYVSPQTGQPEVRLGVIGDTGGGFIPNLYQLDYFMGQHTRESFAAASKTIPEYVEAFVLVYRRP